MVLVVRWVMWVLPAVFVALSRDALGGELGKHREVPRFQHALPAPTLSRVREEFAPNDKGSALLPPLSSLISLSALLGRMHQLPALEPLEMAAKSSKKSPVAAILSVVYPLTTDYTEEHVPMELVLELKCQRICVHRLRKGKPYLA
jgi:hypothetical protein